MYELYNLLYNIVTVWFADVRVARRSTERFLGPDYISKLPIA